MYSRHSFRSICIRGVVSRQSRRLVGFSTRLYARLFAQNMTLTSGDDIISALDNANLLASILTAQIKSESMLCSVQVTKELAMSNKFWGPHLASDGHNLSFLLNDTKKKWGTCEEDLKAAKDEKKVCRAILGCWKPKFGSFDQKGTNKSLRSKKICSRFLIQK